MRWFDPSVIGESFDIEESYMNSVIKFGLLFVALLLSCDSKLPNVSGNGFSVWIKNHSYVEGDSFVDSANKNRVPQNLIGHIQKMEDLLVRLGIQDCPIRMRYSVNMGVCHALDLSEKYDLLLYGSPYGDSESTSLIRFASIVRKVSDRELRDGLRAVFGMPPVIVPQK